MNSRLFTIVLVLFSCVSSYAQEINDSSEVVIDTFYQDEYVEDVVYEIKRVHLLDINFSLVLPQNSFKNRVGDAVFPGVQFGYYYQLEKSKPIFMGIDFNYHQLSSYTSNYDLNFTNVSANVDGRVSSNVIGLDALFKFYPSFRIGPIEPYFQGHLGGKWLYAYLSETGYYYGRNEDYSDAKILSGDLVLSYGAAIGIQVFIHDNYYFNTKLLYQNSLSGKYYNRKEPEDLGNIIYPEEAFNEVSSTTTVVRLDIGLTFTF